MGPPRGLEGADCRLDSAQTNVRSPQPTIYFCKVGGSQQSPGRAGAAERPHAAGLGVRTGGRSYRQAGWGLEPNVRFTATQQPAKELVGRPPFQKRKQARENTRDLPGSPSQEMGLTGVFATLQSASSLGAARGHPREPRQSVGVGVEPSPVTMAKSTEAPYPSRKL